MNITCPICSKKGHITVQDEDVMVKQSGLFTVNIERDFTCEHSYILYIDKNFSVRDHFMLDYYVDLPTLVTEELEDDSLKTTLEKNNLDLVKIFLSANVLTIALKSIFCKIPILLVSEQNYFYDSFKLFFSLIISETFDYEIQINDINFYRENKNRYKDFVILSNLRIIRNPYKTINEKKLKVESQMIKDFLMERDFFKSFLILKSHIMRASKFSTTLLEYLRDHQKEKNMYAKTLLDYLEEKFGLISTQYLEFLIDTIGNYHEKPIKLLMPKYTGLM